MPAISAKDELAKDLEAFRQSEASGRLEGIDPLDYPIYAVVKERMLAGEITAEQAIDLIAADFKKSRVAAA